MPNIRNAKGSKYAYKPDVGVKTDFETILQKFAHAGSVRYEVFAQIWKEMKMHLYCAGRQNQREAREFMEDCFRIAVQFCVPPSSFLVRAGAIYLVYGLYHFQLVNPKVKIRVTPQHWQTMLAFQEEAREQQHLDLDYIFQSLVIERAFSFCADVAWLYPSLKESEDVSVIAESLKESCNAVDEIFSSSGLNQLSLIHDQYHKMKVVLNGSESTKPDSSLDIIHQDLIHGIYKTLRVHRERQANIMQGIQHAKQKAGMEFDDGIEPIDEDNKISIQKGLKKKAFKTFKGYRVRGSDSDQTGTSPTKPAREKQSKSSHQKQPRHIRGRSAHINLYEKDEIDDTMDNPTFIKAAMSIPLGEALMYKSTDSSGPDEIKSEATKGKAPLKGKTKKKGKKRTSSSSGSDSDEVRLQQNLKDNGSVVEGSAATKFVNRPNRIEIDLISDSEVSEGRSPVKMRSSGVRKGSIDDIGDEDNTDEQEEVNSPNKRVKVKQELPMEYDLASVEEEPKPSNDKDLQKTGKSKAKHSEKSTGDALEAATPKDVEPTAQQKLHQKLAQRAKQSRLSKGKKK